METNSGLQLFFALPLLFLFPCSSLFHEIIKRKQMKVPGVEPQDGIALRSEQVASSWHLLEMPSTKELKDEFTEDTPKYLYLNIQIYILHCKYSVKLFFLPRASSCDPHQMDFMHITEIMPLNIVSEPIKTTCILLIHTCIQYRGNGNIDYKSIFCV